ncbi:hypothetical protein EMCRGX_G005757 [Ephydatia muelleri]
MACFSRQKGGRNGLTSVQEVERYRVVTFDEKVRLLDTVHKDPAGGHFGIHKTVSKAEQDAKKKLSELHPVQALSNMLSVTFCLVINSSVDEQSMVWNNPFSTGETLVDSPVLILGCEMEFHFHSLSQILPTNLHSHEQTKQPSDQTLKCYTSSNSFNEVKSDSHFGTVIKIASEELEFTICDTSCEAENEPIMQTNSGTQHFVMKSDFQQLLNGKCIGDNEHLRLICKNLVKSGFFDVYIQGKCDGVFSSINPTELKSLFRKWAIINCKVVDAVQHFLYGIAIDEGYGGNRANTLAWDVLYPKLMISIISKSKEMNYEAELYYVDNLLN